MSHIPDRDRGFVSIGALTADYLARTEQHHGRVGRPRPASGIAKTEEPVLGAGVRRGADTVGAAAVLAGGGPMPEVVAITVYRIKELPEPAKEQARAWYRQHCLDWDWYEAVFADFEAVCGILGVALRTSPARLMGGGSRPRPHVFFRGFWSQGDGACFEGRYAYARRAPEAIRRHAPLDVELHRIADGLQAVQRRNFYQLHAEARHRGHYCHEGCMAITVERDGSSGQAMTADAEGTVAEALRDLARRLYRQLEREYEHLTSDGVVDEALAANDTSFTEDGRRFG